MTPLVAFAEASGTGNTFASPIVQILALVLGAGALQFLISLFNLRREGRKLRPEIEGIIAKSSTDAVQSIHISLGAANDRIAVLEREVVEVEAESAAKDLRIQALERKVVRLQADLRRCMAQTAPPPKRRP